MKKAVEAPKGYHWMKSGKGFKLMKNPPGGYKPHKGASKKASFDVQMIHKQSILFIRSPFQAEVGMLPKERTLTLTI